MARLTRHALDLRLKRRESWLRAAGVTPEAYAKAVGTLIAALDAHLRIPSSHDNHGRVVEPGYDYPDWPTRVKAANALAELVRHTVGLDAERGQTDTGTKVAVVVKLPEWLVPPESAKGVPDREKVPPTPQVLGQSMALPTPSAAESGFPKAGDKVEVAEIIHITRDGVVTTDPRARRVVTVGSHTTHPHDFQATDITTDTTTGSTEGEEDDAVPGT